MTKVLVTGGAGYIGSHTCKALAEAGFSPVVYDNLSFGHKEAVLWGDLEIGDIKDTDRLQEVIVKHNPIAVLHFAAFINVGESVKNPGKYYDNNVAGSLSLLRAMEAEGMDKIVFSSTCATYGEPETLPITEEEKQQPINPYGWNKLFVEKMLADFETAHGLRSVCLRYFNACGAEEEARIGEDHTPETHLIPLALKAAKGETAGLKIFGTDYPTPDGTCLRDYIHVLDLADAHVKALDYLLKGGKSDAFNLGTGNGFSVKEIVDAVGRVTGTPVPHTLEERRPGDPPALVAMPQKAKDILGWEAKWTDVEKIVETAWRFEQKNPKWGG